MKTKVKFAHMLKLTLPVAPIKKPERAPVLLGLEEVRRLEERVPYRSTVPMEERLRAGDRCYAILSDAGEVESFTWILSGHRVYVYELGDSIWVPESVAYFYDAFTFPKARGGGLVGETIRGIVADLQGSQIRRCEAWITSGNKASLRACGKVGFRVYGSWRVAAVGPVRVCPGEPWIGDF